MVVAYSEREPAVVEAREQFVVDDGNNEAIFIARHRIDFADVPKDDAIAWLVEHNLVIPAKLRYIYVDTEDEWVMDVDDYL